MLAKRWIIVGDPKQLSPYVDEHAMAVNVEACLPDARIRDACVDSFMASRPNVRQRRTAAVVAEDELTSLAYRRQCDARGVALANADRDDPDGDRSTRAEHRHRTRDGIPGRTGLRGNPSTTAERLRREVDDLLPDAETGAQPEQVREALDRVRRVALPSVLESLRHGFERDPRQRTGSALSDGLQSPVLRPRHVLPSTQHRMHPEIAAFSHEHVYYGAALQTPEYMEVERAWSYSRYAHRTVWREVRGRFDGRFNCNRDEARAVAAELGNFDEWAHMNPRDDGRPWEAAVLTFYRGQEREVRFHLREWTKQGRAMRHFTRGAKNRPYLRIELCTVDRFQGHEAGLVLISFARSHPTSFLESPNRLNVALTRARYQRVVIGDRHAMRRARGALLKGLAENESWEKDVRKE